MQHGVAPFCHAQQLVVLGDGAPWIWNLAGKHFPTATHIVDLYHAREHVHALDCKAIVAQRLKLSGIRWNVRGATSILTLRCQEASGQSQEIWQRLDTQTRGA